MRVTPTIGVALYPQDASSADALLRQANAALYALAVLRGIVTLADGLGLQTCAPGVAGVAGDDQMPALRSVGCAMLQGPWSQPPMAAPEANAWLATQAIRPAPSARPAGPAGPA